MNKIIYLDSAATMQKPNAVIAQEVEFLKRHYANAGRGVCVRSAVVDDMVANARAHVANFIGVRAEQIVFTSGATDGLNRVVHLIGGASRRVALSALDHNSASVPWLMRENTDIVWWPMTADMNLDLQSVPDADVYVITAMSNVFGVAQNVAELVCKIRAKNGGAKIVVDASQYVVHEKIDAVKWDADFICFSGHKIGADTGVGILYIKNPDDLAPDKFGGGMVRQIDNNMNVSFFDGAQKFEAGTLPLTQIAGMTPAIDWIDANRPDTDLIRFAWDALADMRGIKILTARDATLLSFVPRDMHVLDFGAMMGARGVCLRVGNMCAPLACRIAGVDGCARISVGPQNTIRDIEFAIDAIKDVVK